MNICRNEINCLKYQKNNIFFPIWDSKLTCKLDSTKLLHFSKKNNNNDTNKVKRKGKQLCIRFAEFFAKIRF